MECFHTVDGDKFRLSNILWVIVDSEESGLPFFRRRSWTVEIEYLDGRGLVWDFDNCSDAHAVRDDIIQALPPEKTLES